MLFTKILDSLDNKYSQNEPYHEVFQEIEILTFFFKSEVHIKSSVHYL